MSTKYNLKKILIIRLSSIGDVILTSHLPRLLKNKESKTNKVEVHLLTSQSIAPLFKNEKNYKRILQYDGMNIPKLKQAIENIQFDVILDLQKNSISNKLAEGYKGDLRIINKFRQQKLEMVYLKKFPKEVIHVGERYLDTCRDLIQDDGLGLELNLRKEEKKGIKTVGIAPEAFHKTKQWPQARFTSLIDILISDGYEVRIFGKDEKTLANANSKANNYCGKLSLVETAEHINECDFFITNDTGLMHIASACSIPILAIFGSSVKELGFTPYRSEYELIEHNIWCRPCSHIGRGFCPLGHFKCMNEITVDEVYNKFVEFSGRLD